MYFLGLKDEPICGSTSFSTNKLGGLPDWTKAASRSTPELGCPLCGRKLLFALQIYSPLDRTSFYHRTLYIFCCINPSCWNKSESWKVIRSQEDAKTESPPQPHTAGVSDWLDEQDVWGDPSDSGNVDPIAAELPQTLQNLALSSATASGSHTETIMEDTSFELEAVSEVQVELPVANVKEIFGELRQNEQQRCDALQDISGTFRSYYIEVVEEPGSDQSELDSHVHSLLQQYQCTEGSVFTKSSNEAAEKRVNYAEEHYEKTNIRHGDEVFYKFHKRLRRHPDQLIRFCWNGEPLFISKQPCTLKVADCIRCGANRCFELQIMPALIRNLQLEGVSFQGSPVEFGTVLIYTCKQSCWSETDSWAEEFVFVQADPDESFWNKMLV
ncbi:programmed cell death protein 2-like [Ornithodoros turicata]|uniref:programmed cell death protein 2-like n=1 Tax=Ornithodoros turicata TaxID=34597 RepID=UPI00313A33AF